MRRYLRETIPEVDYNLTLDQAESTKILHHGKKMKLSKIADKYPRLLEQMMNTYQPGTRLFWAIQMVYNSREEQMRAVTNTPKHTDDYIPRFPPPRPHMR